MRLAGGSPKHWRAPTLNLVVTYRPPGGRLRETSLVL
jgi:hypothetical protein